MKVLILSLFILIQTALSHADNSPFHQSHPDVALRIRKAKNGPDIQWLKSKDPKVRIGLLHLKVPKSDIHNCTTEEIQFEYNFPGTMTVNTAALGPGYPEQIEIPMNGRKSSGQLKPGRKIHIQVRLKIQESPIHKVSFDSFLLKGEKGKCP